MYPDVLSAMFPVAQVLPWVTATGQQARLVQRFGREEAAILVRIARARERADGSLPRFRTMRREWLRLIADVAATIERMPLWKLQTIGRVREDFLYPNDGKGRVVHLKGEAV